MHCSGYHCMRVELESGWKFEPESNTRSSPINWIEIQLMHWRSDKEHNVNNSIACLWMTWLAVPHELAGFLSACLTRTLHNFLAQHWRSWIWSRLVRKGMLQKGRTKVEWARWRHILYGFNTGPYNSDLTPLAQCTSFATGCHLKNL